jgi:integrase
MPRKVKRRRQRSDVPGLTWRGDTAYWQRNHERLPDGRVVKSLSVKRDRVDLATGYAAALNTLMERGDWGVFQRWVDGTVHVTDIVRAVREGEHEKLKRLHIDGVRLGDAVDSYLRRAEGTLSVQRNANFRSLMKMLLQAFGADLPMHTLTREQAESFLHSPKTTTGAVWAIGTQREARTVCKALWSFAMETELEQANISGATVTILQNPWRKAKVAPKRRTRFAYCTPAEALDVVNHPRTIGLPRRAFMAIAFYAGLRDAEMRNLRPGFDVDLDRATITVQSRKAPIEWRPKTDNSERTIPIPAQLVAIIREHIALGFAGERYLFRLPGKDAPLSGSTARKWAEEAYTAAGLKYGRKEGDGLTLHSARHSHVTWLLSNRVPLPTVAKRVGDTAATILEVYAHVMPTDEAQATELMNTLAMRLAA